MINILTLTESFSQLPSPPISPNNHHNIFKSKNVECSDKQPIENSTMNKFMDVINNGIQINDEMTPYPYIIKKLHSLGNHFINKKTTDAIQLRVYEIGKENYKDFWVHPLYLSLQSYQFFKLFEEIKNDKEEDTIIEIEIPSLNTFPVILYWIYTGNLNKLLEIAKLDKFLCEGIIKNILTLDIIQMEFE
ncbi:hypothetical protein U3516DRAFT_805739 [Neocallimastix sp. 'constans']